MIEALAMTKGESGSCYLYRYLKDSYRPEQTVITKHVWRQLGDGRADCVKGHVETRDD